MQKVKCPQILCSRNILVFILCLKSKTPSKRKIEALENLRNYYPYDIQKESLIIKKNKNNKSYICFVLKDKIIDDVILTILYAKNHFKSFTGYIHFYIDDFVEIVQLENGNIEKVFYSDCVESCDGKNIVKISKEEVLKNYKSNDVYKINENQINQRRIIFVSLIFVFACFIILMCCKNYFNQVHIEIENKKQLQEIEKQKQDLLIKNKKKLVELENQYLKLQKNQFGNIYNYICILYSCIEKGSVIENLSIDKNNFSVDVTTRDALKILARFEEKTNVINEIKMNRTVVQDNKEFVSYSGKFIKSILLPKENLSIEEKINFYQNRIEEIEKELGAMKIVLISEYAKNIRKRFHLNSCVEQYIQYRIDNNVAILECSIKSTSSSILKFFGDIQSKIDIEKSDIRVYVKKIQIINSENRNNVQTTIQFWTGIEHKEDFNKTFIENEIIQNDVSEINVVFQKNSSIRKNTTSFSKNKKINQVAKNITVAKVAKSTNLKYVGSTKVHGKNVVIIKNLEMNNLYKLPLLNNESELLNSNFDCCVRIGSGKIKALIRGNVYEVAE